MKTSILFWLLIILIIICAILLIYFYLKFIAPEAKTNDNNNIDTTLPNTCNNLDVNGLINVSSLPCCCPTSLITGQSKYLDTYSMLIAPDDPISYISVCTGYCTTFDNTSLTCTDPNNPLVQTQFNDCLNLLAPNNCNGPAKPIGYDSVYIYYVQQAGVSPCTSTWDCNDINQCTS